MRSLERRIWSFLVLVTGLLLASCKTAEPGVCDPTDPFCGSGNGNGNGVSVASATVISSIDTVVAIGGPAATLTAEARDASSNVVTGLTWNYSSLSPAIASVNAASGVVTASTPGTATMRAQQDNNSVTGQLRIRAVPADLPAVEAALADDFVIALRDALGTTPQGVVNSVALACQSGITSGNVLEIDGCLNELIAVSGTGTDDVLLTLLDLFFVYAQDQLQL